VAANASSTRDAESRAGGPSRIESARPKNRTPLRHYLRALGPGLVTGASDDDPSGIATYTQAGAQFGYGLLWPALITLPLMAAVQEICDRTALATGKGLGELAAQKFSGRGRRVLIVLTSALIVANTLNITADLLAVGAGMALLHAGPSWVWALIAGSLVTALLTGGSFHLIARVFKVLCVALLAYLAVAVAAHPDWSKVLVHTAVPSLNFSSAYLALLIAVLGTTMSPYLFFWQSAHRIEELRDEPQGGDAAMPLDELPPSRAERKQRTSRFDVFGGMAFSNLVMFAIIVSTAATLHAHGQHKVSSAAEASEALRPIAGQASSVLFALGFIGAGMLAIPVLAGSGAAGMAGLVGKRWGFSRSVRKAPVFYCMVAAGTIGGTLLSLLQVNPMHLLVIVAVINGLAAAPFLLLVLLISADRKLMGEHRNGRLATTLGWLAFTLMGAAATALVATSIGI
jgi:NRAMP (natural resistance-associated macrophage protein)-like metal ion transporter